MLRIEATRHAHAIRSRAELIAVDTTAVDTNATTTSSLPTKKLDLNARSRVNGMAAGFFVKNPLLRSLAAGVALVCAAAILVWTIMGDQAEGAISAGILYLVDSTGDGDLVGPSTSCDDGTGYCTLRAAIEASNLHAGTDFISFNIPTTDPGYSNGMWTINLSKALPDIFDAVSISGPGADKLTVSGGNAFRVFNVTTTGTVSFSGLSIAGGAAPSSDSGGGIQNGNVGTVNVTNCTISSNSAGGGNGGGIYSYGGTVNITNSTLSGNSAYNNGGGIYNHSGTANVTNSTISGNFTIFDGGGIYNELGGTLTVTNSTLGSGVNGTLSGNSATHGGGILNAGTANVINSTLSGNSAIDGGGIFNDKTANVTNSTISSNSVAGRGGGIENTSGSVNVKSTIIALNTTTSSCPCPDVDGVFSSSGFNLIGKANQSTGFTAATDQAGTIASPLDPKLDPSGLKNNGGPTQTIALLSGSPAIDKGSSTTITGLHLTTDQRGVGYARTVNKSVPNATGGDGTDIGAFEFGAQIKAVSSKQHGTVGNFSIKLPLFGPKLGVECRKGGTSGVFKVILTFPSAVTVSAASVTPDPAAAGATASVSSFSVSGSKVTVNLTGVSNAQRVDVNLLGVSNGTVSNDLSVPMGVLLGDVTGDGSVAGADVTQTQSKVGQAVTKSNFREDVTADGSINNTDVNLVQSQVGTSLP